MTITTTGKRSDEAELFTTAVSTLGSRRTSEGRSRGLHGGAYESGDDREIRIRELTHKVALERPSWVLGLIQWLRDEGNMRTVTTAIAAEFVKARLDARIPDETNSAVPGLNRTAINVSCGRLSDTGEMLDYWIRTYGRAVPSPVKRGVGDALTRLLTERSALAADGQRAEWRLGDVIELVHPTPKADWQSELFRYLLDRRHDHVDPSAFTYTGLPVIKAHEEFRARRTADKDQARAWLLEDPTRLREAGLRWEDLAGLGVMDKDAWEAVIPFMGYLALLRNLRNFDTAGIGTSFQNMVKTKLADPKEQERAGLFPLQLYAAIREVRLPKDHYHTYWTLPTFEVTHWDEALEVAVNASVKNIPALSGNTLVLVDVSGSMISPTSGQGSVTLAEHARLFGTAVALRAENADLFAFDTSVHRVDLTKAHRSVIQTVFTFPGGGGTDIYGSLRHTLHKDHTRVIIITDEQATTSGSIHAAVGADRSLYVFNVAGYAPTQTHASMPLHKGFAGLTDQAFRLIPLVEAGDRELWPFAY